MTSGGRRGRRDNGLIAAEYAAVGDVDPRVGEHLLDVLEVEGIAAYLAPSADLNPLTLTTTVPARPTDRLYVDRRHLGTAQEHLSQLAPAAPDIDTAFARIVAGYDTEVPRQAWPESENVADDRPHGPDPAPPRPLVKSDYAERSLLDGLDTFGADLPDEDQEGYTPPVPPPLPRPSAVAVAAVIAIIGGFILFLRPTALPISDELAMFVGLGAIVVGFIALIWRLRPGDDEDEDPDPDNGAVV
jgi:hypothetical protein